MRSWKHGRLEAPSGGGLETIELTLRFITPVFGGGVDAKKADLVTPVRAAAIRGQLRFWWRATSELSDVGELREKEVALFGGVHGKGPVASKLEVAVTRQPGKPCELSVYENGEKFQKERGIRPGLAYGAFPLRADEGPLNHDKLFCYKDDFDVVLRFPSGGRQEVERALSAFLHLGGLGGRTRRGFGAVELVRAKGFELPAVEDVRSGEKDAPWPIYRSLEQSRSLGSSNWPKMPAHDAHERGLAILYNMRQRPGDGRNPGQGNTPGRSRWPEADAIRTIQRRSSARHAARLLDVDKFPRAAFGAPIIFQFKDKRNGDPQDSTLVPVGKSRLASPLLIRPHPCDGGYAVLAARIVEPVGRWELQGKNCNASVHVDLTPGEAAQLTPLRGATDPITAYFKRLRDL